MQRIFEWIDRSWWFVPTILGGTYLAATIILNLKKRGSS